VKNRESRLVANISRNDTRIRVSPEDSELFEKGHVLTIHHGNQWEGRTESVWVNGDPEGGIIPVDRGVGSPRFRFTKGDKVTVVGIAVAAGEFSVPPSLVV
jgi:hypothetical protein